MSDRRLLNGVLEEMSRNPKQLQAVAMQSHCVVLAGPGSGKTKTLTAAMARTLLEDVTDPRGIACVTYNNECALELQTRLTQLGIDSVERTFVGTVHSFALGHIVLPYGRCVIPGFSVKAIATRRQVDDAVAAACAALGVRPSDVRSTWRRADRKRKEDVDRTHSSWLGRSPDLARLIEAYEAELRKNQLIDFDDMPLLAARIVRGHAWVRNALLAKFPVLFVDEYQDLAPALHELVLQLCFNSGVRLFAVGDPDQSIYRFTGANATQLKALAVRQDVTSIELPFNYRCGLHIIDASKAALGEERNHQGPEGAPDGTISFDPVDGDIDAQADFIMTKLVPGFRATPISLDEVAVLYRDADRGTKVANAATAHGIPFVRADKHALIPRNNRMSRFVESAAQWVTGGWKNADPPFRRLVGEAAGLVYGGTTSSFERYELEAMLASFLHRTINCAGSTHAWLADFRATLLTPWRARARVIIDDWEVVDMMLTRTDNTAGNTDIILPVFSGRFEQSGRLNLSTLHSAKGREFDVVVLFDMNRATLPSDMDQRTPEDLTDARRLFYVGVTRARKQLHLVFKTKNYSPWVAELYRRGKKSGWIA